jgi:hypothetical protein
MIWVDTFHNDSGIMFSHGSEAKGLFNVFDSFPTRPDSLDWGWCTEILPGENGELVSTHYSTTPEVQEWKGVETIYQKLIE